MRLVEYDAKDFLEKNKFKNDKRKNCTKNGFVFGMMEFFDQDFWLEPNSDYTDKDFIKAVYERNKNVDKIDEVELLESLARFLCGYDVAVNCGKQVKDLSSNKQHNYFQNQGIDVNDVVTDKMIQNKIDFIKEVLYIN